MITRRTSVRDDTKEIIFIFRKEPRIQKSLQIGIDFTKGKNKIKNHLFALYNTVRLSDNVDLTISFNS